MSFICVLCQPKFVYGVYRYIHINLKQIPYHSSFTGYLEISAALIWLTVVSSSFSASSRSSFTLLFAFFFNSFHRTFLHPPKTFVIASSQFVSWHLCSPLPAPSPFIATPPWFTVRKAILYNFHTIDFANFRRKCPQMRQLEAVAAQTNPSTPHSHAGWSLHL